MTSIEAVRAAVLRDAIALVATYASGATVELDARYQRDTEPLGDDDVDRFLHEFAMRHALASARQLLALLPAVERSLSSQVNLRYETSRGVIRGRLDVPRYIARRSSAVSLPREYPLIVNERSLATPENRLVATTLLRLGWDLRRNRFGPQSAEGLAASAALRSLWLRRTGFPWRDVPSQGQVPRLVQETRARVRRRQTGNDTAYRRLADWAVRWSADVRDLAADDADVVVDGMLAFPASDQWWDRVFEIWLLKALAASLERLGGVARPPRALHEAKSKPIYVVDAPGGPVELWFQRAMFSGERRWRYVDGNELYGIHDVVATRAGAPPLIVDAKFRWAVRETRAEETFKMLGYADNQRLAPDGTPFSGLLVFPGPAHSHRVLEAQDGSRLDVIVADLLGALTDAHAALDGAVAAWLP